jgi:hypothetical protein
MPQNSIHVRLGNELLAALDEWRRDQPDLPTKPEALRRALQQAVATCRAEAEVGNEDRFAS